MQSGISVSQELVSQFNDLLASDTHFALLATISSEQLRPLQLLTPSSRSSFASNVESLLQPHIKPNEALYIILRRYSSGPALVAVTYVPDTAPVRQKMLFASTRLTLVRELGSEHFRDTWFATTPDELTPAGFEKHDAHSALEAPLTEEERSLGDVRRAEQEAGIGTATREIHLSKNMATAIADEALDALKALGAGERSLVMLKINPQSESVELVPDASAPGSIPDLVRAISPTEPRFTFYRFTHTHNGIETSPLLFFYTCPTSFSTKAIKFRMMYPLMKRSVLAVAEKEAGLQPEKKFEVEDASEITEQGVIDELHPRVEVKTGFSRPKRPGR
ncbi:actin depolymerizing protein [Parathielavia appendiculata]|uniref:Actin depolymerizing protein n=1 Tax=Parathielavia appendiculata TaxID=2587402 RepID=A0AAN6TR57_9PEZI|nr:actin depolymerizing protein [Parathielavia appendiculata]